MIWQIHYIHAFKTKKVVIMSTAAFNRPTDQRNPIENYLGIRPKKCCNGTLRSLASVKVFADDIGPNRKFGPMTEFKQIFFFTFLLGICPRPALFSAKECYDSDTDSV